MTFSEQRLAGGVRRKPVNVFQRPHTLLKNELPTEGLRAPDTDRRGEVLNGLQNAARSE